jgi:hypothetical protein
MVRFTQFFSLDSAKAIKAREYGYLNAINYMAPADTAGVGDLCPFRSKGCTALCLGWYSGQAGMVSAAAIDTALNSVRKSRQEKARLFMKDRGEFLREMIAGIERAERKAKREGLRLCVRLNGATDIAWEGVRLVALGLNVFEFFPHIQFVDYTKSVKRALAHANHMMPRNYHLTFSRSEDNEADCERVLAAGGNVAVVFAGEFPNEYMGAKVLDGDDSDLRHLDFDARGCTPPMRGYVIALSPKGTRAKHDTSGFVVR